MLGPSYRVCLVCSGNICRSPMAAAVLGRMVEEAGLAGRVEVGSAGTGPWHVGESPDPRAVRALKRRGYPPPAATARQFRPSWFAKEDLVLALDSDHASELRAMAPDGEAAARIRLLRSFDPDARGDLDVPDPYYSGPGAFERCLAVIEPACRGVLETLREELGRG